MAADVSYIPANVSRESWINVEIEVEQSMQSYLDSLDEELSNQPGFKKPPTKIVRKCVPPAKQIQTAVISITAANAASGI